MDPLTKERRGIALFRDHLRGESLLFHQPRHIILAEETSDILPALSAAEAALDAGYWLAGYISYEAGYLLDPALERLLPPRRTCPLLALGVFDEPSPSECMTTNDARPARLSNFSAAWSFADYRHRFDLLHRHLHEGDCYQGNLTFPIRAAWDGDPLALFNHLSERQPVRYASFIDLHGPVVVSLSPELFFNVSEDGSIEAHPMKGTMSRGGTPEEDKAQKLALKNDPKNQAENRMIVDLLRNDIARISAVGTLDVPELFRIESYPTVHQMVSRVRARLRPATTFSDIFKALFPCGSITGAPKISAMKILRDLEPEPRGVYCGAIGWAAPSGRMRFSVAIRTISLFPGGKAVYNVGGGVVLDSTAEAEYAECMLKARFAF